MASSSRTATQVTRPRISSPSIVLADVVSYGFAAVVILSTLQFDLQFAVWQGVVLAVLFLALRGVAHELRKDARREYMREARRLAALRAQSPARWSVEQRDGLGRRVDIGA